MGKFCDNALTPTMNDCPEGTFMPRYGATGEADCVPCPSGFYCPIAGTITPTLCDVGKYCPEGSGDPAGSLAIKPADCTPGYYCPIYNRVVPFDVADSRTDPAGNEYPNSRGPAEEL